MRFRFTIIAMFSMLLPGQLWSQAIESQDDPYGISLPYPFVHLQQGSSASQQGTTRHLKAHDPWLLYLLGRDLVRRHFELTQGAFGHTGEASVPMYAGPLDQAMERDSKVPRFARDHASSCLVCHSNPRPDPGSGQTIGSTGSLGRNTPHIYGSGLIEMIGEQVQAQLMQSYDTNQNGFIDRVEVAGPSPAIIAPIGERTETVDYGNLAPDEHGVPQLNSVFRVWFVDARGRLLSDAHSLNDDGVAGFNFRMMPFGWGRGEIVAADGKRIPQGGEAATVRQFFANAANVHMGMELDDPTLVAPSDHGGSSRSLIGAIQHDFGDVVDRASSRDDQGRSQDDPDGDGITSEFTSGDADAVEFYLLHAPQPTEVHSDAAARGRAIFSSIGCNSCHVENWRIEPDGTYRDASGDRRYFHLTTETIPGDPTVGRVIETNRLDEAGERVPIADAATVEGIFSDFKHWDIGEAFHERRYDGSFQNTHRTAPLWGVGSTAPYGHSGQFSNLHDVIRAHGGAAADQSQAYLGLSDPDRSDLVAFLNSLQLYVTDTTAVDLNGDAKIEPNLMIAGQDVGYERFDPRLLVRNPPKFRKLANTVDPLGRPIPMQLLENPAQVYGLMLDYRRDDDGDGWPDLLAVNRREASK